MSATQELTPPAVRWDLSEFFDSPSDARIEASWTEAHQRADRFASSYRGKIESADLTADTLHAALTEMELLGQDAVKPIVYANLLFAADTSNPELGAFLQDQTERSTDLNVKLMFFELELQATPQATIDAVMADTRLAPYRHYVQVVRTFSPYRLSEREEILLEETANSGCRAWVRLHEELTANHVFKYKNPKTGEVEELTESEVIDHLRDADRAVRQAGADALSAGLKELEKTVTFIYNTLLLDKRISDKLRKHPYPEHTRHLANELEKETVDLVVRLCSENAKLVERFYHVKREILGLPELTHIDRYAPLFEATEKVSWEDARAMVVKAFTNFHPVLGQRCDEFFEKGWIDAEPRKGKSGGAFCSFNTPDSHPVMLMTYLNKVNDVMTLAHELGHGVHASLSREQTYFNFHGTLPMAELASIFGEMLVFEDVVKTASTKDKLALYGEKIEGIFASAFRQAAMFGFEQRCHNERREKGELTSERFGEIWQEQIQGMFGDSIKLGEQHRVWWVYVGHFFHAAFYVYAYAFGELLTLALYEKSKQEGPEFAEKYINLLRLGGSRSPQELMATVGVDLNSEAFWKGGFAAIENLVAEYERLWAAHQGA